MASSCPCVLSVMDGFGGSRPCCKSGDAFPAGATSCGAVLTPDSASSFIFFSSLPQIELVCLLKERGRIGGKKKLKYLFAVLCEVISARYLSYLFFQLVFQKSLEFQRDLWGSQVCNRQFCTLCQEHGFSKDQCLHCSEQCFA